MRCAPIFFLASLAGLTLCAACRTDYDESYQRRVLATLDSGDLAGAAALCRTASDDEQDESSQNALLWHLEAATLLFEAGDYAAAKQAAERAERLAYLYDRQGNVNYMMPGRLNYIGMRQDRVSLGILQFLLSCERGEFEDALLAIRRVRNTHFDALLHRSDPEIRAYDAEHAGQQLPSRRQKNLFETEPLAGQAYGAMRLPAEYDAQYRRSLAMMFNPLGFYLSALGYCWDNDFDEAALDYQYLYRMMPDHPLVKRDYATVLRLLAEPLPSGLKDVPSWDHSMTDRVVTVIFGYGRLPAWNDATASFQLPGMVPAKWTLSHPASSGGDGSLDVRLLVNGHAQPIPLEKLVNLREVLFDEYCQLSLPELLRGAVAAIRAQTAAHESAKTSLLAMQASPDFEGKALTMAAAQSLVVATRDIRMNDVEWRRWSTAPSSYRVGHFGFPADGKFQAQVFAPDRAVLLEQTFVIPPDATRAVLYLREIAGRISARFWCTYD